MQLANGLPIGTWSSDWRVTLSPPPPTSQLLEEGHTVTLLRQDKEYLARQVSELTGRCAHLEERCGLLSRQLDEAKIAKEKTLEHIFKAK